MASMEKFTHAAMSDQNGHIDREHNQPRNPDIDPARTYLNYSFPMKYKGLKPFQYYKKRIGELYLYGRGTKREKKAVTGCGWIVTLPRELYGNSEKELAFFNGVYNFIADRYGRDNIINNSIHYDESGFPHIHVIFTPVTTLNHDMVQYKTKRTKTGIQLESGRWEYKHIHVDKNGKPADENDPTTWVKLNNYARMSDYYNEKVDSNSVMNAIELRHFHPELQKYLIDHGIEGKVVTGKTGTNFTVKELKNLTLNTGKTLDEVKEMMQDNKSLLQAFVEKDEKVLELKQLLQEKDQTLSKITAYSEDLEKKLAQVMKTFNVKQKELERAQARIEELESEKSVISTQIKKELEWGNTPSSWGDKEPSGWGNHNTTIDEEKTW